MRRVTSPPERGAMAVMMAVIISSLMIGLGYIVVTIGGWYVARTMDQNAADAAAEAVAEWCGTQLTARQTCSQAQAESVAAHYANGASNGGWAQWAQTVCGTLSGLTACPTSILGAPNGCPTPAASGYVDVLVTPRTGNAPTMVNLFGTGTQRISACAQAGVITAGSCAACVGVTISLCEWNLDTANGTAFAGTSVPTYLDTITARRGNPAYGIGPLNLYVVNSIYDPRNPANKYSSSPPAPSNAAVAGSETVLYIHGGSVANCPGATTPPGGFGWTAPTTGTSCSTPVTSLTYPGAAGNASNDCYTLFNTSRTTGQPIYIPVYDSFVGGGSGTIYHLAGLAAFVVTGWDIGSGGSHWGGGSPSTRVAASVLAQADTGLKSSDTQYCGKTYTGSPSDSCVYGYFTHALVPNGVFGPGPGGNLGIQSVSLVG